MVWIINDEFLEREIVVARQNLFTRVIVVPRRNEVIFKTLWQENIHTYDDTVFNKDFISRIKNELNGKLLTEYEVMHAVYRITDNILHYPSKIF